MFLQGQVVIADQHILDLIVEVQHVTIDHQVQVDQVLLIGQVQKDRQEDLLIQIQDLDQDRIQVHIDHLVLVEIVRLGALVQQEVQVHQQTLQVLQQEAQHVLQEEVEGSK